MLSSRMSSSIAEVSKLSNLIKPISCRDVGAGRRVEQRISRPNINNTTSSKNIRELVFNIAMKTFSATNGETNCKGKKQQYDVKEDIAKTENSEIIINSNEPETTGIKLVNKDKGKLGRISSREEIVRVLFDSDTDSN